MGQEFQTKTKWISYCYGTQWGPIFHKVAEQHNLNTSLNTSLNTRYHNAMLSSFLLIFNYVWFQRRVKPSSRNKLTSSSLLPFCVTQKSAKTCWFVYLSTSKAPFCSIKITVFQVLHLGHNAGIKINFLQWFGTSRQQVYYRIAVLRKFATFIGKQLQWRPIFSKVFNKNNTQLQVFFGEVCKVFENSSFTEHLWRPSLDDFWWLLVHRFSGLMLRKSNYL